MQRQRFFSLPSLNELLQSPRLKPLMERLNPTAVIAVTRNVLDEIQNEMMDAVTEWRMPEISELTDRILSRLKENVSFKEALPVNGTGIFFSPDVPEYPLPLNAQKKMVLAVGTAAFQKTDVFPFNQSENINKNQSVRSNLFSGQNQNADNEQEPNKGQSLNINRNLSDADKNSSEPIKTDIEQMSAEFSQEEAVLEISDIKAADLLEFDQNSKRLKPDGQTDFVQKTGEKKSDDLKLKGLKTDNLESRNPETDGSKIEFLKENTEKPIVLTEFAERQLSELTGAESAFIVNSLQNAQLLLTALLGNRQDIIISRSDLYESPSGYRLYDLFNLFENNIQTVGAVNRTTFSDFQNVMDENTGFIYLSSGRHSRHQFCLSNDEIRRLSQLAAQKNIPLILEVEFASLVDLTPYFLDPIPTVSQLLELNPTFLLIRGNQLIGAPPLGLIFGKARGIDKIKRSRLTSFFLPTPVELAGLSGTLEIYQQNENPCPQIPILQMISTTPSSLNHRAKRLQTLLEVSPLFQEIRVQSGCSLLYPNAQTGRLPTFLIRLIPRKILPKDLRLRLCNDEIILQTTADAQSLLLDLRTVPVRFDADIVKLFEQME